VNRRRNFTPSVSSADIVYKFLFVIFTMFMLATILIKVEQLKKANVDKKAEFQITMQWPDEVDCDNDLWVRDPQGNIIFYRDRNVGLTNLERDDYGSFGDIILVGGKNITDPENKEEVYLRGVIPGEYVVNTHVYRCFADQEKVGINAPIRPYKVITKLLKLNPTSEIAAMNTVTKNKMWQEDTAFRFTLSATGEVINTDQTPMPLVSKRIRWRGGNN
jgi:hypothetical protein